MSNLKRKLYPRSCPICKTTWWTPYLDKRLTCGSRECKAEARRRGIPIYSSPPKSRGERYKYRWSSPRTRVRDQLPP